MQQTSWGTSFVEATQLIALLNLFLELTVTLVAFKGPLAVTVSSNQRCDHQQGDRLERPLNRTTRGYV